MTHVTLSVPALRSVLPHVSTEASRPILNGVLLEPAGVVVAIRAGDCSFFTSCSTLNFLAGGVATSGLRARFPFLMLVNWGCCFLAAAFFLCDEGGDNNSSGGVPFSFTSVLCTDKSVLNLSN